MTDSTRRLDADLTYEESGPYATDWGQSDSERGPGSGRPSLCRVFESGVGRAANRRGAGSLSPHQHNRSCRGHRWSAFAPNDEVSAKRMPEVCEPPQETSSMPGTFTR